MKISDIKESFLSLSNKTKSRYNFVLFVVSLLYLCSWIILAAVLCHSAQKSHIRISFFVKVEKYSASAAHTAWPSVETHVFSFIFAFYVILLILVDCMLPPWEFLIKQNPVPALTTDFISSILWFGCKEHGFEMLQLI